MLDGIALELRWSEVFGAALSLRPIFFMAMASPYFTDARRAFMSSTRHADVLGDNLTGLGKSPTLHPAYHADFDTG